MMTKDFNGFYSAMKYANEMRSLGFKVSVEEFFDFKGPFYTVFVWEQ